MSDALAVACSALSFVLTSRLGAGLAHDVVVARYRSLAGCKSAADCPGQGSFAGNWGARPLSDIAGPLFPDGVRPIYELGKNMSVSKRRVEGVLWMMITGTMQVSRTPLPR